MKRDELRAPAAPDQDPDTAHEPTFAELRDLVVEGADWSNRRAPRIEYRRAELRRCRLTGADLGGAALADVTFVECSLELASFRFAKLERVAFVDCRMRECDLYEAALRDVLFERADLGEAVLSSAILQRVELRGCRLDGIVGTEALRGARMPWLDVVEHAGLFAAALGIVVVD